MSNFENLSPSERHALALQAFLGDLDARGSGRVFLPAIDPSQDYEAPVETGEIIQDDMWSLGIRTNELGLPRVTTEYVVELGRGVLDGTVQRSDR